MNKITDKIYHGCETRYANDERKLIDFEKCEKCQVSTSEPFWKKPTECCMETRNLTKKRQLDRLKLIIKLIHKSIYSVIKFLNKIEQKLIVYTI